jgi:5-methylcytosine-specific restriction endonuclease McrA
MKVCPKCQIEHSMNGKFCSPSCANSRIRTEAVKNKIRDSITKTYAEQGSKIKGKPGWKHTDADKELKKKRTTEFYDRIGRQTEKQKRAKSVATVQAYRARKYSATPPDVNRKLIREIYENCPSGYEVDHIVAISNGGPHHQDNLQYLPAMENRRKNRSENYDRSLVIRWQDVI